MRNLDQKGFTLIEVLAVVVLIAILGMIAGANVLKTINQGKDSSYDMLVRDIKTASCQLIDELDYVGSDLYYYTSNGEMGGKIMCVEDNEDVEDDNGIECKKSDNKVIVVNLQTLVSNGFLTGNSNEDTGKKIILNPKNNEDIGSCQIKITKKFDDANHSKVSYIIENESSENKNCPTTEEYE